MVFLNFGLTADTIIENGNKIVLVKRKGEPYKGKLEMPGGFVEKNETVEEAAIREVKEETSLKVKLKEILGVYSRVDRDPRKRVVTIVFIAEQIGGKLKAGSDASDAKWVSINDIDLNNMAFDHSQIVNDYLKWRKEKFTYWSTK